MKEIFTINEAYLLLKEGLILKDLKENQYKLSKEYIYIRGNNASYKLLLKEFLNLYQDTKFVLDDEEGNIDLEKDKEYYSFKHK